MIATWPDLLRLLVVPVFAGVAIADIRTRRVPRQVWPPIVAVGLVTLAWDGWVVLDAGGVEQSLWLVRVVISLGIVLPLGVLFWRFGAFGLADAKALVTLAVVFPTYPVLSIADTTLPLVVSDLGVFSFTILLNAVLLGIVYPLGLAGRNAVRGRVRPLMVVGIAVPTDSLEARHGRLLEGPDGFTQYGLDLDALRMYLRWRDTSLAALRADPATLREPASLPESTADPGDGRVRTDGGTVPDDEWGARAFVEATGGPYGTRVDELRAALDMLATREHVWISPGIPFLLLVAAGLAISLTVGSLFTVLAAPLIG